MNQSDPVSVLALAGLLLLALILCART